MTPQIKVGDEVIFKREKLTKEWLIEYGTSSAYLTYTVSKQEGSKVFISSPFDLPGQDGISEVVIDLGSAKGQNDPIIIHSKDPKNKTEKTSAA